MPKIDKRLRAHFNEWSRRIIASDRAARKYGRSQNTIGEIERALAEAFLLGRNGGETVLSNEPSGKDFIEWIEIPPRARRTLFSISAGLGYHSKQRIASPPVLERVLVGGRHRWRVVGDNDKYSRPFSDGGVSPLMRLALLERLDEPGTRFALTELGIATCREFWRRWKDRDPTLPLMGVGS
ncbi:MAG: hypothetical protein EOR16_33625 [Mesorhizobium sp.]|uniref:hypothetical protein n=1 Tax=Mesorhizobium sp. TaxID=1871066 RepID=UPI000FE98E3F|nr:hypothetical protein [Mesorhizobium sp.]RWI48087.1 MAG: hypothetical protein EOR16_33625 [Mesorhizobium sp.]